MTQARHVITAPRIEVVLVPDDERKINASSDRFDIWLVLHIHDGAPPTTIRVDGGPFDRADAVQQMAEMWGYIGREYAEATAARGV